MEKSNQLKVELGQVIASLEDYLRCRKEEGVEGLPVSGEGLPSSDERLPAGKARLLRNIRQELGECTRCKLHRQRTNIVYGVGNPEARLVFVGEGPGEDEDRQGEPFVGRAGQLLTKIIGSINLSRDEVYIANIIKCRPPGNQKPGAR